MTVDLPDDLLPPQKLASTIDDCGNIVLAWSNIQHAAVVRVFARGTLDWARSFSRTSIEASLDEIWDVAADEYGSIFVAAGRAIIPIVATGERHPAQTTNVELVTSFLQRTERGFLVGVPGYGLITLPRAEEIWGEAGFGAETRRSEWTLGAVPLADTAFVVLRKGRDPWQPSIEMVQVEPHPERRPRVDDEVTIFQQPIDGRLHTARMAKGSSQVALAFSVEPEGDDSEQCLFHVEWPDRELSYESSRCLAIQDVRITHDSALLVLVLDRQRGLFELLQWNPDAAGPLAAAVDIGHGPPPESPRSPGLQPNLATMLAKDDQLFIATFGEKRGTLTIVRLSL